MQCNGHLGTVGAINIIRYHSVIKSLRLINLGQQEWPTHSTICSTQNYIKPCYHSPLWTNNVDHRKAFAYKSPNYYNS